MRGNGVALLCVAVLVLLGGSAYLVRALRDLDQNASEVRRSVVAEVNQLREAALAAADADHQRLLTLRDAVAAARLQAARAAGRARSEAQRRAEELTRAVSEARLRNHEQISEELISLRAVAVAAHAALGDLSGELNQNKEEIAAAQSGIEQAGTAALGASAGLAGFGEYAGAHARDLAAMYARRERDHLSFTLTKSASPQTVGGVPMRLRRADPSQNTYTLELQLAGRTVEQRDRTLNEPVRFFLASARQPWVLVIDEIGKDQVRGYLSAPRTAQAASN